MIGDWYTWDHKALRADLVAGKDLGMPDGVLIDGKGPYHYNDTLVPDKLGSETIKVDPDNKDSLPVVAAARCCPLFLVAAARCFPLLMRCCHRCCCAVVDAAAATVADAAATYAAALLPPMLQRCCHRFCCRCCHRCRCCCAAATSAAARLPPVLQYQYKPGTLGDTFGRKLKQHLVRSKISTHIRRMDENSKEHLWASISDKFKGESYGMLGGEDLNRYHVKPANDYEDALKRKPALHFGKSFMIRWEVRMGICQRLVKFLRKLGYKNLDV